MRDIHNRADGTFSAILKKIFIEKKTRNPRFSLRAYARVLNIPVASLSQIMAGKRGLSLKNAIKIMDAMEASSDERRRIMEMFMGGTPPQLPVNEMGDRVPREECLFYNTTFSIKKTDLPKLNQKIAEFVEQFGRPKSHRSQEEIYTMNVQLFPLVEE